MAETEHVGTLERITDQMDDEPEPPLPPGAEIADESESRRRAVEQSTAPIRRPSIRHSRNPCLSPDGTMLASVVVDDDGYPRAVQRPLGRAGRGGAGDERRVRLPVHGPVRRVAYSENGQWLACEIAPDGGEREQIWLVTTDPDDPGAHSPYRITDATMRIVCWDGDNLAVTAYDDRGVAEGRLLDPSTERAEVIDRRMGGELVDVRDGVALFRVGSRGNRELLRILPGGEWRALLPRDPGSTTQAGRIVDAGLDTGVTRALVLSDHSGDRPRLLEVRVGAAGSEVVEVAARDDADLDGFEVSHDGTVAALMWNHAGASRIQLLDLTTTPSTELPSPELPTVVASHPSLTRDGELLAFTVEGAEFPPRVVMWDVRGGRWTGRDPHHDDPPVEPVPPIGDPGPLVEHLEEDDEDWSPLTVLSDSGQATFVPELIRFPARDGLELTAWVYRASDEPAATLVYFHGGPEGQSRPGYHNVLRRVVDEGFTVVAPNVRGSSGAGRAFCHADERYSRPSGIDDVADTVAHLVETGVSDPGRMVVGGRSYGGYLTLATLVRHAGLWKGGIAACGMSDLETFYANTEPWVAIAAFPKYGHPLQEQELLRELSPIHGFGAVDVPVLFVHGMHDTNVPLSESLQAAHDLRERGVPVDMLLFEDEGHEFVKRANRQLLAERVAQFMREVVG